MPIQVNLLLEVNGPDEQQGILRVLGINRSCDVVYVIRIDLPSGMPEARKQSEFEEVMAGGTMRELTADPFAYLQVPLNDIPKKHRRRRDAAMKLIEPIIGSPNGNAFDPDTRGALIREVMAKTGTGKKRVYECLRRFWMGGMTPNALLPRYANCGAAGKLRKAGTKKRGRPPLLTQLEGRPPGVNIGSTEATFLEKGYREFYEKTSENGGVTKQKAYEQTLQKYFKKGLEMRGGVMTPVLPPAHELPTFKQFNYWATENSDVKESLIRRGGERKFNLKSRALLGDSTNMAFGPGSLFQIDSTPADIELVSALDRARRIGRPTMFFLVDTFSRLITGFHVGIDNPSFFSAGLAIENSTVDKVEFCAQLDIEISPEDWPSSGLPEAILADRGEMEGYAASNLVQSLGIRIANTSPYRADLKGIVERTFRSMDDLFIHDLPGAVQKPKERGERNPRLDGVLTLNEFRTSMVHAILQHNSRRIETFRLQKDMITDQLEPRPVDLWQWGTRNRTGHLRSMDPAIIRANLLPLAKATVTGRGIKFRGVHYGCDRAMSEGWFEKVRSTKTWKIDITVDPRTVDSIYLRPTGNLPVEICQLLEVDHRFLGTSWAEVDDFFLSQKTAQDSSKTKDLQAKVNMRTQISSVVKRAETEAANANKGLTKAARLNGVRKNRDDERRQDHVGAVAAAATESTNKNLHEPTLESAINGEPQKEYVPAAAPLEMLKQQRNQKWNNND